MATPSLPKKKEPPAEPFKRALGLAVRAIAGDDQVQVSYIAGKPELDGNMVQLPEPSRVPSKREIAVIRGWADSFALTAAVHDPKLHRKLMPEAGPARAVFESVERARVESVGANRMAGMASNLTAKIEDQYSHGRYADVKDRNEAPLEEAVALMVRERLTGEAPPKSAAAMVNLWRGWVEQRLAAWQNTPSSMTSWCCARSAPSATRRCTTSPPSAVAIMPTRRSMRTMR